MAEKFVPSVPINLQIRKIIFEKFNDPELRFTNDEIFVVIRDGGDVDPSWDAIDIEDEFTSLCESGLLRNIAQNFNTVWYKLFDVVEETTCGDCTKTMHLGRSEDQRCLDAACGSHIRS